jgi:hypothetical protein
MLAVIFGFWILKNVYFGFSTGQLKHTNTVFVTARSKQPAKFWLILVVQMTLAIVFLFFPIKRMTEILITLYQTMI